MNFRSVKATYRVRGFIFSTITGVNSRARALVSKAGVHGIKMEDLPKPVVSHIIQDRVAHVEVELEAYINGDKDLLLQLVLMDHWTRSEEQAKNLLEDILTLHYHEDMYQYYR